MQCLVDGDWGRREERQGKTKSGCGSDLQISDMFVLTGSSNMDYKPEILGISFYFDKT